MHRAQIILEKWQYDALRSLSERKGQSVSNLVREAVDVYLRAEEAEVDAALRVMEGIGSDPKATGRKHDAFVYPVPRRR